MKKLVFIFALSFFLLNTAHAQLGFLKRKRIKIRQQPTAQNQLQNRRNPKRKKTEASFRKWWAQ